MGHGVQGGNGSAAGAGPAPLVSVLMPTFEQAAFIGRALASLQAQTRWELIIVDDGAEDDTAQVLEPWLDDERIRYQRLPHNEGFGRALNRALDAAAAPAGAGPRRRPAQARVVRGVARALAVRARRRAAYRGAGTADRTAPHTVAALAAQGIHLHFYGDFTQGQWREWIVKAQGLAPHHLHLHANVAQDRWVGEFSRYDAGWLHCFTSYNGGEIRRADWDDLTLPARIATLAKAGVPMIQRDNGGAIVAAQSLARTFDIGLFHRGIDELGTQLREPARMAQLREQGWRRRMQFCFDTHAPALLAFFREVISRSGGARRAAC
ncbi:glycosyltransferase family 2 protein [Massilia sp. 9096]|uniref:glycosyltransferase family 2 protein n=1 Tax=Massilia sp. 9096 TaxID=1500894 RepID=UPI00056CE399|nr:glycosyltransferase family 2 protein [Massilia sp. 9096]